MFAALVLAFAISTGSPASPPAVDQTEAWRPMHAFIGTWKSGKVTRTYASAATNHHLEITESAGGHERAVWGIVSYDPALQGLVLRHFSPDGGAADLALDPAASTADRLVFVGDAGAAHTRLTYERAGWNTFVERVEQAAGNDTFALVAETRFERRN
jgi:hypothetical protein